MLDIIRNRNIKNHVKRFRFSLPLYLLLLPAVTYLLLFAYVPMYGVQIAFRDYTVRGGITGSPWVGFHHFITFFNSPRFFAMVRNTLTINFLSLVTFPVPILLAFSLYYCNVKYFKKIVQMATYAPHFISVVVLVGMIDIFFSPSTGIINTFITALGGKATHFMLVPRAFKYIFVGSGLWQSAGWGSIIYIGTLTAINPELHEAAVIDGATKIQRILHVDLPGIAPTIIIMFILRIGNLMELGFQKVYLMQNPVNLTHSEVISTYVYKIGLLQNNFSYSSAINLFNTAINILLLIGANAIARKLSETSLF